MTDEELYDLYVAEHAAYVAYRKVAQGDDLGPRGQVSPKQVREARDLWYDALLRLRKAASTHEVRAMLQRRHAEMTTKVRR